MVKHDLKGMNMASAMQKSGAASAQLWPHREQLSIAVTHLHSDKVKARL